MCALVLYGLGMVWGYFRLPLAAIRNLADYGLIERAPTISFETPLGVSSAQRWYLGRAMPESVTPVVPRISVDVEWNALIFARVRSSHYIGPTGMEGRDSLFVNVFGAWFALYDFNHVMA